MLQQNNNNNYPCLNMSGSTPEMLQKCSRASLPFPSRLELGDLPLIRGLRAWALCSKNRRKAGGLLGGGQAPTPPPAGRRGSTSCPRPADVYLSGEWGHMAYGLPLGPDAGQAGIRALVTVATLKTSEGSGKTQTQCLFLQTEKGSCLYSAAKPVSGVTTSAASSVVRGWLKGKTGGGGSRDAPARRRDHGSTPAAQSGANRVRVRSGRRWRKSCNAAGWEKTGVSRDRHQSSREDPAGEITLDERQEERDKGGPDSKQFPSPQQDIRRARQEKEGAFRSPRCCHNASPKTCTHFGRKARRRESQDDNKGGESPRRGIPNRLEVKGMRKERNEEEQKGGPCELDSSNTVLAVLNPDLESTHFHPESHSNCEEIREVESNKEMNTQTYQSKDDYSEKEEDRNAEVLKIHTNNESTHDRKPFENPSEEIAAHVNGFSELVEAQTEKDMDGVDVEEYEGSINLTSAQFSVVSNGCEDVSVCTCPAPISTAVSPEPSSPVEGSTCTADRKSCGVLRAQESSKDPLSGCQQGVEHGIMSEEELDISNFEQQEQNCVADENSTVNKKRNPLFVFKDVENRSPLEERNVSSAPLSPADPTISETTGNCSTSGLNGVEQGDELVWESREEESQEENIEQRVNPGEEDKAGEIWRRECTCKEPDDCNSKGDDDKDRHTEGDMNEIQEDDNKNVTQNCALKDTWRLQVSAGGDTCGDTSITHVGAKGESCTNVTHVACADPSTSLALSLANPAPSLPLLTMTTGLPCLEAEKKEGEAGLRVLVGEGGQEGKRRRGRELEEQGEEERGSTVATGEGSKVEEEEDEFGVFMQAEGELAWSEGSTMPASVPCGSSASVGESHGC